MMLKIKFLSVLGISLFMCMPALAASFVNETGKVLMIDTFEQFENLMTGQSLDHSFHYILLPGKKATMKTRLKSFACNGDEQIKTTYRMSVSGAPVESTPMLSGTFVESCAEFMSNDADNNEVYLRMHQKERKLEYCYQDGYCLLSLASKDRVDVGKSSMWENGIDGEAKALGG